MPFNLKHIPWNKGMKGEKYKSHYINGFGHHTGKRKNYIDVKKGKTLKEYYGEDKANLIIKKMRAKLKNRIFSIEWRRKISESLKGRKLSKQWRKRMSATAQGIPYKEWKRFVADMGYNLSEFNEYLKEEIRIRDRRKCLICNANGVVVHHIDYNKKNCSKDNLVTLCRKCHSKTNWQRENWKKYFLKKKSYNSRSLK